MGEDAGKIYFCFPYRGAGGVSLLFLRMGVFLAEARRRNVVLIDYADGFMAQNLRSDKVELIEYHDDGLVDIPADATLVLQSNNPWSIFPGLRVSDKTTLIFWNCFPFNLVPVLPGLRDFLYRRPVALKILLGTILAGRRKINSQLVRKMHDSRSIFFMDDENLRITERFLNLSLRGPVFLPIPALPQTERPIAPAKLQPPIGMIWVGRIADFKVHILWRVLQDVDDWCRTTGHKVTFSVIGNGNRRETLKSASAGLEALEIKFVDEMPADKLHDFLSGNGFDLGFCMGTSALECARLGIPTVLLDATYGVVSPSYRYRWLHEETGYTLGRILFANAPYPKGQTLADLMARFLREHTDISTSAFDYFENNHALPAVADRFLSLASKAEFKWHRLSKGVIGNRDLGYRLFAVARKFLRSWN